MIVVLIGKSAAGKDRIMNCLVDDFGYQRIVTYTTRPPREGEVNGKDYYFLTEEEFLSKEFIEQRSYDTVYGKWYYGSSKDALSEDKVNVIILDIDGAIAFKTEFGDEVMVVYVDASDMTRQARALGRGSYNEDEWNRRLEDDKIKFSLDRLGTVTDYVVNNDGVYTPQRLAAIIDDIRGSFYGA